MFKAVIFDMDGLMFDTEIIYNMAWCHAAGKIGKELTAQQLNCLRGSNGTVQGRHFMDWYGPDVPFDLIKSECRNYMVDYFEEHEIPIKPGLFELLNALKEKGYKIAIATSTRRSIAHSWWVKAGVDAYPDITVCGDEVHVGKPDPAIFIRASEKLDVTPDQCIVLEDSFNGIRAAKAAGCSPIMIPDQDQPTDEIRSMCDHVLDSLEQVIDLL